MSNISCEITLEVPIGNVYESILDTNYCIPCLEATQHRCRKCDIFVCTIFCSVQDPNSDNDMHIIQESGEICRNLSNRNLRYRPR